MTLTDKIIDKIESSSRDWREEASGNRSLLIQQQDLDQFGKQNLLSQARELEALGLIRCDWFNWNSDISKIHYSLELRDDLYRQAGRIPKSDRIKACRAAVLCQMSGTRREWIREFYDGLLKQLEEGKEPELLSEDNRELHFACFSGLDSLVDSVYKRIFSKKYLGDSKIFEKVLESRVVSAARRYCAGVDENMSSQEVLAQLYLDDYATELALKGDLVIEMEGRTVDLSVFRYGALLNSATLKHTMIPGGQKIRKITTVENKANYMSFPYEEGCLVVFSHGYFSPLEREFLITLRNSLEGTQYYHTGDLDYGGVRIFRYIQDSIFPELQPCQMDVETYETYFSYGTPIEASKLKKLAEMKVPVLQELIDRMCRDGIGIEQEAFLF